MKLKCYVLVGEFFEVIENPRNSLMLRQLTQPTVNKPPPLIGVEIREQRVRDFPLDLRCAGGVRVRMLFQLGEQAPSLPVPRQVIEGEVGGNRFQPAARRWAAAQLREVLIGS